MSVFFYNTGLFVFVGFLADLFFGRRSVKFAADALFYSFFVTASTFFPAIRKLFSCLDPFKFALMRFGSYVKNCGLVGLLLVQV